MFERSLEDWLHDLQTGDARTRSVAAYMLGERGEAAAVPALVGALHDASADVRNFVVDALGKLNDESAVPGLIDCLQDVDSSVRYNAADALGQIRDPRAVRPLIDALADPRWRVREVAIQALAKIGDERLHEPVIDSLFDVSWQVREAAAVALGEHGDWRAVDPLIELMLYDEAESLQADFARAAAAEALGRIGHHEAIEPLIDCLIDADDHVPGAASRALRIFGAAAVPGLCSALASDAEMLRHEAAYLLGEIGDGQAVGALEDVLYEEFLTEDGDPDVIFQDYLLEALHKIGTPEAQAVIQGWQANNSAYH